MAPCTHDEPHLNSPRAHGPRRLQTVAQASASEQGGYPVHFSQPPKSAEVTLRLSRTPFEEKGKPREESWEWLQLQVGISRGGMLI